MGAPLLGQKGDALGIRGVYYGTGLGDEGARMRPDRVHMLSIAELRRCESGAIAPSDIGAVAYSY